MTCQAHRASVDLVARVTRRPVQRMGIAANAADLVAIDAIRSRSLIVAAGAGRDVAPGERPVRLRGAGEGKVGRVRASRVRPQRREILRRVAAVAEGLAMAAAAKPLVGAGLYRVTTDEVGAMNEVGQDLLGK